MKHRRIALALAATALWLGTAQAATALTGEWKTWVGDPGRGAHATKECATSEAQLREWFERLHGLRDQLRIKSFDVPPGYHARWVASWNGADSPQCKSGPLRGQLSYLAYPDGLLARDARTGEIYPVQSTSALRLHVNELRGLVAFDWSKGEDDPDIGTARVTGRFGGFPIIEEQFALVTPPGAPPAFVAAPAELVLRRWIAKTQQDLDGIEQMYRAAGTKPPADVAKVQALEHGGIERARAMLSSLDAKTRGRPIWLHKDGLSEALSFEPAGDDVQVMWANPAFFEPARSRSGIRVFSVAVWELASQVDGPDLRRMMADAIDWQALSLGMK